MISLICGFNVWVFPVCGCFPLADLPDCLVIPLLKYTIIALDL